jgi:hypothetical protein
VDDGDGGFKCVPMGCFAQNAACTGPYYCCYPYACEFTDAGQICN